MANRPLLPPFQVITNGAMTGNLTSLVSIVNNLSWVSYAYSWSGTSPVGTIKIQVSNDYKLSADGQTVTNAGTWTDYLFNSGGAFVTSVPVTGNTGHGYIEIDTAAYAVRTVYTFTSGTGTLQAYISGKVA